MEEKKTAKEIRKEKKKVEKKYLSLEEELEAGPPKDVDLSTLNCTGCGIKLQYESPEHLGYLSKSKVYQHYRKLEQN